MSLLACLAVIAQLQVAHDVTPIVDAVVTHVLDASESPADRPVHLDVDETLTAFGADLVAEPTIDVEGLAKHHGGRIRASAESEVVTCTRARFRCTVVDDGLLVSVLEVRQAADAAEELRVVVEVKWQKPGRRGPLWGYAMELFLKQSEPDGWEVVRRGTARVY